MRWIDRLWARAVLQACGSKLLGKGTSIKMLRSLKSQRSAPRINGFAFLQETVSVCLGRSRYTKLILSNLLRKARRLAYRAGAAFFICILSVTPVSAFKQPARFDTTWPLSPWTATLQITPEQLDSDPSTPQVQIFDVQQERVITTRPNSSAFRGQVELWILAAQGLSSRSRLEADSGLVIRIPLQPPLSVDRPWLTADIIEVYLFLSPQKNPHLLLFSREGKPYVIDMKENPKTFLKEHGLLRYLTK